MTYDKLLAEISFNQDGLVPCIAQCHQTGRILMMAWMNKDAIISTLEKQEAVYWSRSRQKLWHKGEQSGHTQKLKSLQVDCDGDTLIAMVEQIGGIACHTGTNSCFFRAIAQDDTDWRVIEHPIKSSDEIYKP